MVLDTHVLVWWLASPTKLTAKARRAIRSAMASGPLSASAASILEIVTLVRRGRLTLTTSADRWLEDLLRLPELRIESVTAEIAAKAGGFGDEIPGDPLDRIILATAAVLGVPLVTADQRLRRLQPVPTIW
ncbi:MAG: type II toxin-antitoxin system VapC family toxin [Gammaproteobacteria bacterium]